MSTLTVRHDVPRMGNNGLRVATIMTRAEMQTTDDRWTIEYWNTGGGVMCIVAQHPDLPPVGDGDCDLIYIGDNSSVGIGWSNCDGEQYGEFDTDLDAVGVGDAIADLLNNYLGGTG